MNPRAEITEEGQAAAGRIAAARKERDNQQSLQVSANSLVNPPRATTLSAPKQPPEIDNVGEQVVSGLLKQDSQNVRDLQARESEFAELTGGQSGVLIQEELFKRFGITPERQARLDELDAELDIAQGKSDLRKTRIGQGNSIAQGNREITQEDREEAVRSQTTASQAATLRGSIELGRKLAGDALIVALADRTFNANNILQQINQLQGKVTQERQEQLDAEKVAREAELLAIKEAKDAADLAFQSGAATPDEISSLTNPNTTDEDRLALAQSITARGASEDRDLDVRQSEASIASSQASTADSRDAINSRALDRQAAAAKDAEIKAAIASGAVVLNADQQDTAMKLSKDFVSQSSDFKKQVDAYNRIVSSAEDPSAAGDVAVVFNYMKMLDPGSVVRESEFALAASTGSLDEAIQNKFGKVATGEILGFTRDDFVDRAGKIYSGSLEQQIDLEETMRDQAIKLYGMSQNAADLIISDVRATGAVSEVVFGLTMDGMSDEQLLELTNGGLLPKQ